MKTTLIPLVLLVLVVLVVSCKKKKSLTETAPSVSEQVSPMPAEEEAVPPAVVEITEGTDQMGAPDEIKSVKIVPDYQPKATDPYELVKAEVSGDELLLVVSYGGGCEPHEFELVEDGTARVPDQTAAEPVGVVDLQRLCAACAAALVGAAEPGRIDHPALHRLAAPPLRAAGGVAERTSAAAPSPEGGPPPRPPFGGCTCTGLLRTMRSNPARRRA